MDGLSTAASVIAVIQLTAGIVNICGSYLQRVRNAKDDISSLQQVVMSLERTLRNLKEFLQGPNGKHLSTLQILHGDITNCHPVLIALKEKIDPGKKPMRRLGIRSLKWPLKITEVEKVMQDLERYKLSFTLCLQIDQTYAFQLSSVCLLSAYIFLEHSSPGYLRLRTLPAETLT